jgi:hypothetical protein
VPADRFHVVQGGKDLFTPESPRSDHHPPSPRAEPLTGPIARRLGTAAVAAALAGLAVWLALRNLSVPTRDGWIFWVPGTLWLLTMSSLCWWSTLSGHHPASRTKIRASWRMGWIVGATGLAIGFLGPLVVNPRSNLGPLLGILLTGPLGFVAGAAGTALVRTAQKER